jgi:hypothetical protein
MRVYWVWVLVAQAFSYLQRSSLISTLSLSSEKVMRVFLTHASIIKCRKLISSRTTHLYCDLKETQTINNNPRKQSVEVLDGRWLYQRYRVHLIYSFQAMVVTLAKGNMISHISNMEQIRSVSATVSDHDSFGVLCLII